ncbi:MAG: beta-propeller domain-containing protein [Oscillospiraceae bacterium]|nr:beta-propeller domain-containing protein [Oscillospiraceae bacterium]
MNIDKKLRSEIENIEVPDELLPENIAAMLKAKAPQKEKELRTIQPVIRRTRSSVVFRSVTAIAACAALIAGFAIYSDRANEPAGLDTEIEYKDVSRPDSYDDLYDIYTQIYLNGSSADASAECPDDISAADFADGLSDADLIKADNGSIYFVGGGKLYKVTEDGMAACASVGSKTAVDMYITGGKLILISENYSSADTLQAFDVPADNAVEAVNGASDRSGEGSTADEGQINGVSADIYDISDGVKYLESFTQSGEYVSSRVYGGNLSIVTNYSNESTEPLGEESDLDNYVPCYDLNNKRIYVAAEDIYVAADAASTEYTVVSSYNINGGAISVKAVLGSSGKVYCSGDTLYIVNAGQHENDKPYSAISAFSLGNAIEYLTGGSVEGSIIGSSLSEYGGCLRAAAVNTMEDGSICTDIYVLDADLNVVNSAGQLLPGKEVRKVTFTDRYASLYTDRSSPPELVLDLSANPPTVAYDMMDSDANYFVGFGDSLILGVGMISDETGKACELSMFSSSTGVMYDSVSFGQGEYIYSDASLRRRSLLVNTELGIIGMPVSYSDEFGEHGCYYLFRYTSDNGFNTIGKIEYTDPDESGQFHKAIVSGDTIYLISDARVVAARISDMSVIRVFNTSE